MLKLFNMDDKSNEILSQPLNPQINAQAQQAISKKKPSSFKKYTIIGLVAVFLIIVGVAIFLWIRTNNTKGVEIQLELPETGVQAGIPFSVIANIKNKSNVELKSPSLPSLFPKE